MSSEALSSGSNFLRAFVRYEDAQVPIVPLTYQFSPLAGTNSMILVPPATAADTRPKYHISVSMNCFIPSSYITSIRRGGTENGEEVGDFEYVPKCNYCCYTSQLIEAHRTGKSANVGTVCIRGSEAILSSALIFARNYVVSDNSVSVPAAYRHPHELYSLTRGYRHVDVVLAIRPKPSLLAVAEDGTCQVRYLLPRSVRSQQRA